MVESTYSTAYSPSSSSSRSQQQNVERVTNRESLRPDTNVFGNGDMTNISSIGIRLNNGERFSMNRGVRESLIFSQNTSNLSRLPNKMEIARQRESLRPDHSASTNSLSNQLIGEQIRGRFRVKRFLGEGAFGEVYRALNENGTERALKLIKKDEEWNERNEESLQRIKEIDLLQRIQHENLLRYFEHFDEVIFGVDCLCLVSEFCENGDLKSQINYAQNTGKRISDLKIVRWMVEATTGLKHLHDEKIIHRNIKPSNLLLTKNNVIKLADFGVTKYIDSSLIFNLASCRAYMSPEISHFMQFTKKADIWSLGCVLYELANLKVAFPLGARFDDDQPVTIPELGSSRFTWILKSMLELNKEKRIDANDLFETLCFERSTIEEEEM